MSPSTRMLSLDPPPRLARLRHVARQEATVQHKSKSSRPSRRTRAFTPREISNKKSAEIHRIMLKVYISKLEKEISNEEHGICELRTKLREAQDSNQILEMTIAGTGQVDNCFADQPLEDEFRDDTDIENGEFSPNSILDKTEFTGDEFEIPPNLTTWAQTFDLQDGIWKGTSTVEVLRHCSLPKYV